MSGQIPHRANILAITNSLPCTVTTDGPHGFTTFKFIRFTNLNGVMPIPHGADQLNNNRYRIVVTADDEFYIEDPITFHKIDSSPFPPYVDGGYCNLIEQEFVYYNTDPEVS